MTGGQGHTVRQHCQQHSRGPKRTFGRQDLSQIRILLTLKTFGGREALTAEQDKVRAQRAATGPGSHQSSPTRRHRGRGLRPAAPARGQARRDEAPLGRPAPSGAGLHLGAATARNPAAQRDRKKGRDSRPAVYLRRGYAHGTRKRERGRWRRRRAGRGEAASRYRNSPAGPGGDHYGNAGPPRARPWPPGDGGGAWALFGGGPQLRLNPPISVRGLRQVTAGPNGGRERAAAAALPGPTPEGRGGRRAGPGPFPLPSPPPRRRSLAPTWRQVPPAIFLQPSGPASRERSGAELAG